MLRRAGAGRKLTRAATLRLLRCLDHNLWTFEASGQCRAASRSCQLQHGKCKATVKLVCGHSPPPAHIGIAAILSRLRGRTAAHCSAARPCTSVLLAGRCLNSLTFTAVQQKRSVQQQQYALTQPAAARPGPALGSSAVPCKPARGQPDELDLGAAGQLDPPRGSGGAHSRRPPGPPPHCVHQ